jgi:protein-S-isoprenylcysteine O-methyltransferase Ste14
MAIVNLKTENMKTESNGKLFINTLIRYFLALLLVGLLIFLPAGSFKFWNGWLYIVTVFIPMFFVLIYLFVKDPDLLKKRMKMKEREKSQRVYLILSIAVFIITYIVPGLDYRFQWSDVPIIIIILSTCIVLVGYLMFFMVMKQNSYASRIVEIQTGQKLIDTGLYAVVRHPMYSAAIILYGFSPLVLGSFYALIPMVFIPVLLIIRIINEEKVLINGLKGYDSYMKKVKYRLFPFIW